jgi:hypothetical protein
MSKDYAGALNFATDAWSSPNHRAFIAVTVYLERDGALMSMLLDILEVAEVRTVCRTMDVDPSLLEQSHSGFNLAAAFAKVLTTFGISEKVSMSLHENCKYHSRCVDPQYYL